MKTYYIYRQYILRAFTFYLCDWREEMAEKALPSSSWDGDVPKWLGSKVDIDLALCAIGSG